MAREIEKQIPLAKPFFDGDELSEVKKALDSGWVSAGPKVKEFESACAEYLGVKHAIAVCNCTAALHASLLGVGIKAGDEVLVSDFTFPATGHAVLYCGAKPVFVDSRADTYNIDSRKIEEKITNKTKAMIPVHAFGQPVEMDEIMLLAKRHGIRVIEDAACAFGAKYKGRFAGTIGDIGCFSFHARKGITTGEGGMVVTNDKALAERVRHLSVFGMKTAWERKSSSFSVPSFTDAGFNYKMSDITAAVGVAQLKKLERIIERKRRLALLYNKKLAGCKLVKLPFESKDVRHVYQTYAVALDDSIDRNKVIFLLAGRGIQAQIGTYSSCVQPVYSAKHDCPVSINLFSQSLALPLYFEMAEEDVERAASALLDVLEDCKK